MLPRMHLRRAVVADVDPWSPIRSPLLSSASNSFCLAGRARAQSMERKLLESTCRLAGCLAIALTSLAADTTLFQLRLVLDTPNASAEQLPVLGGTTARTVNVQKIPLIDLQDVESAAAATEKGTDKPIVTITLTPEGRKRLAAAA